MAQTNSPCRPHQETRPGWKFIGFRAWVKRPDGTIVTAKELGVRGIPIWVPADK